MRVQNIGDGNIYIFPLYGVGSSTIFTRMPYIRLLISHAEVVSEFDTFGYLNDGALDAYGERTCDNYQLKGSAVAVPSSSVTCSPDEYYVTPESTHYACQSLTYRIGTTTYGPVPTVLFVDTLPDLWYQDYPDFDIPQLMGYSFRNARYLIMKVAPNTWQFSLTATYKGKAITTWRAFSSVSTIEIDSVKHRIRAPGYSWYVQQAILRNPTPTTPYYPTSFPDSLESFLHLEKKLSRLYPLQNPYQVYGDLVRRCANDARVVQSNSLELSRELASIASTLKGLVSLARADVGAKSLAQAFLSYKYGVRLTYMDLQSIRDDLIMELEKRSQRLYASSRAQERYTLQSFISETGNLELVYNYKIIHSKITEDWRDGLRTWFNTGLFPSLKNAWDLVPLSFVIDWFAGIEDYLDAIDANTYWHLYSIREVVYSEKRIFRDVLGSFSRSDYPLIGDVAAVYYRRHISPNAHKPSYFEPSPRIFSNYAELAALVIANSNN